MVSKFFNGFSFGNRQMYPENLKIQSSKGYVNSFAGMADASMGDNFYLYKGFHGSYWPDIYFHYYLRNDNQMDKIVKLI